MSNRTLFIQLSGPRQSYSLNSRPGVRDCGLEPTKSAMVGILAASQGLPRTANISRLAGLQFGVRIDRLGAVCSQSEWLPFSERRNNGGHEYRRTFYRENALFLVAIQGEEEFLRHIAHYLQHPVWAPCLGRKDYFPDRPLLVPDFDHWLEEGFGSLLSALGTYPSLDSAISDPNRLVLYDDLDGPIDRWDQPISFQPRRNEQRTISLEHVSLM